MNTEETIDIKNVLDTVISRKKTIFVFLLLSSIVSVATALTLPNFYKSEALLEAVSSNGTGSSSGLGGDLGSLASMAGVDLGGPGGGKEAELAIAITQSRDFFNSILREYDFVLPSLMAVESYDSNSKALNYDEKKYDNSNSEWKEYSSLMSSFKKPSNDEAYRHFVNKVFKVSKNNKTGYLRMTVEHKSPVFAKDLLEIIIKEVNQKSRQKALEDSSRSLVFLREEASLNRVNLINESISNLIQNQLQTQMMAKVHEDYLLKVIDSPYIPEKKSKPQRAIICIVGLLAGFFLSLIYILITSYAKREK